MITKTMLMWIGTVGLLSTFGGLYVSVPRHRAGQSSLTGLFAFGMGFLFYGIFTLHATAYLQLIGSGVVQQVNTPSLMLVGIVGAALNLLLLFDAAMRVIGDG